MIILIQLTTAGTDTGPFNLYSDVDGFVSAFELGVTRADLLAGYTSYVVPDGTTIVRVISVGVCTNYIDLPASTTTTTTTIDPCSCITLTNNTGIPATVVYIPCNGGLASPIYLPPTPGQNVVQVCGSIPDQPGVDYIIGSPCIQVGDVNSCTTDCCNYIIYPHPTEIVYIYPVDCNGFYLPDVLLNPTDPPYVGCGLKTGTIAYAGITLWPVNYIGCPCSTTTTTTTNPPVPACATIIQGDNNKTYLWDAISDNLYEITLPGDAPALSIAFTQNKIWKLYKDPVPGEWWFNQPYIKEWDFNYSTQTATFSRTLTFDAVIPDFDTIYIKAFHAVADDTLIIAYSPALASKDYIYTAVIPPFPSTSIPTSTIGVDKVSVVDIVFKDSLLVSTNKVFVIGKGPYDITGAIPSTCNYPWIAQYPFPGPPISSIPEYIGKIPFGYTEMAVVGNYLYLFTGDPLITDTVVKLDITNPTAGFTPAPFSGAFKVTASSSLFSCHTPQFTGNIECQTAPPEIAGTKVYNGITMYGSGSGAVIPVTSYPVVNCSYTSLSEPLHITYNEICLNCGSGAFDYTVTFDYLMNDVILNIGVLNTGDNWLFYTDGGALTLTILEGCGAHIVGNQIIVDEADQFYCYGVKLKITTAVPYSYIRITSPTPIGTGNGGPVSFDCDSIVSSLPNPTTSTTTTASGVNTIYTHFSTY